MSSLKQTDISIIQRFIEKKTKDKGYVWDFTNATFKDFVDSYTGKNIDEDKYKDDSGSSKMKRLKKFLAIEDDASVCLLIEGIKDYGLKRKLLYKSNGIELDKYIKKLKSFEKIIEINRDIFKSTKKVEILIKDINENISKKNFELAIDRLHTFFKGFIEILCISLNIEIENKSLDALYGEIVRKVHEKGIFKEKITEEILSSSKKIMKSFDFVRNNRSFAHTNDIISQEEAEFLCIYILDLYKFLSKINIK